MKIGDAVMEPLIHSVGRSHRQRRERPLERVVRARPMNRYPHEFSGQRQRICIARASLLIPSSSFATNRSRRWMSQCRRKC